jgi:hypothetical protein
VKVKFLPKIAASHKNRQTFAVLNLCRGWVLRNRARLVGPAVCALLCWSAAVFAATVSGEVSEILGAAYVQRDGQPRMPLSEAAELFEGDVLFTGPSSTVALKLADGSRHLLSSNSTLRITTFRYNSDSPSNALVLDLIEGGLKSVTGDIGSAQATEFTITTPHGSINASNATVTVAIETAAGSEGFSVLNSSGVVVVVSPTSAIAVGEGLSARVSARDGAIVTLPTPPRSVQAVESQAAPAGLGRTRGAGALAPDRIEATPGPTPPPTALPTPIPTDVITQPATPSPAPTAAPTTTPTSSPTSSPTPTPPPTSSPTPKASPTPPPPPPTEPPASPL